MYKGYKVTKRLKDYIGFAQNKFEKLNEEGKIDLWEILSSYEIIAEQSQCVQHYIYDLIMGTGEYEDRYTVLIGKDGGVYVRYNNKSPSFI